MRKPDFLIVGGAKSGTTSLARYLDAHPNISIVSERLEFFGEYENPAYKIQSEAQYLKLFKDVPASIMAGEKSVSYLYASRAPSQIYEINPRMKILIILRNPIFRAYSDYWHRVRQGVENLGFNEALEREEERIKEGARFELHYKNYGLYYHKVKNYIDCFGENNVVVVTYDELKSDPKRVCDKCFEVLGVDRTELDVNFVVHNKGGVERSNLRRAIFGLSGVKSVRSIVRFLIPFRLKRMITLRLMRSYQNKDYPSINPPDLDFLRAFYKDDVKSLSSLLGRDLEYWLSQSSE